MTLLSGKLNKKLNKILSIYTSFATTTWCSLRTKFTETCINITAEMVSHAAERHSVWQSFVAFGSTLCLSATP